MGKTTRWFRSLLTGKKEVSSTPNAGDGKPPKTKRWSFVRSFRDKERSSPTPLPAQVNEQRGSYRERGAGRGTTSDAYLDAKVDPNKHAIAVAAATAAVAEAAVAAAQAAAAVVKLTSSGRCTAAYVSANGFRVEDCAAVKIQAAFRGYLARRALHALKGLVRLQALVRGHIVRKGTIETMRCMQALVRVQARARAGRAFIPESLPNKPSTSHNPGPATPEKYERTFRTYSTRHEQRCSTLKRNSSRPNSRDGQELSRAHMTRNRLDRRMDEQWDYRQEPQIKTGPTDDEKSDKILEIDPGKPHLGTNGRNTIQQSQSFTTVDSPSKDSTTAQMSTPSLSSGEVQSVNNRRVSHLVMEDETFSTAENSPQFYSASSRGGSVKRGPFTPTISDCSRSFLSGYSDYPSYMSNTESSKAKVRSQSAPKQRLEFEKSSSTKRYSLHGSGDARLAAQRACAALHANFTSKAYPGSGRLDRLGMPIRRETIGYSGAFRTRY